jgi:hypothetical protein
VACGRNGCGVGPQLVWSAAEKGGTTVAAAFPEPPRIRSGLVWLRFWPGLRKRKLRSFLPPRAHSIRVAAAAFAEPPLIRPGLVWLGFWPGLRKRKLPPSRKRFGVTCLSFLPSRAHSTRIVHGIHLPAHPTPRHVSRKQAQRTRNPAFTSEKKTHYDAN